MRNKTCHDCNRKTHLIGPRCRFCWEDLKGREVINTARKLREWGMARQVVLTGKDAIEYAKTAVDARWAYNQPIGGLVVHGNEVDGDGYDPATIEQAQSACDEDPSLVEFTLSEKRANNEFTAMAEAAANCYGKLVQDGIESRTATVQAHGETVHAGKSTPSALAAARLYAAWDADQIDWSEIIPECFSGFSDEIKDLAEQAYYDWMRDNGTVCPAKTHELAALKAEAACL